MSFQLPPAFTPGQPGVAVGVPQSATIPDFNNRVLNLGQTSSAVNFSDDFGSLYKGVFDGFLNPQKFRGTDDFLRDGGLLPPANPSLVPQFSSPPFQGSPQTTPSVGATPEERAALATMGNAKPGEALSVVRPARSVAISPTDNKLATTETAKSARAASTTTQETSETDPPKTEQKSEKRGFFDRLFGRNKSNDDDDEDKKLFGDADLGDKVLDALDDGKKIDAKKKLAFQRFADKDNDGQVSASEVLAARNKLENRSGRDELRSTYQHTKDDLLNQVAEQQLGKPAPTKASEPQQQTVSTSARPAAVTTQSPRSARASEPIPEEATSTTETTDGAVAANTVAVDPETGEPKETLIAVAGRQPKTIVQSSSN
jgi:hypothetical protein